MNIPHHAEISRSHNFSQLLMSKIAIDVQKHLLAYARLEMSGCRPAEAARCASVRRGASWGPLSEKVGRGKNVFGTPEL